MPHEQSTDKRISNQVLLDNQNRICSGNYRCAYSLNSTESEYGFVKDGHVVASLATITARHVDIRKDRKPNRSVKLNLDGAPKVKPGMPDVRRLCTQIGTSIGMDFRVQEVHPK
ncbi:hypothetical protein D5086_010933 [Populus alba]|uniref:Uncharacterized protein n=1 Tax=Populus alba TaxID=43335 RepID=A0ACC4CCC4_POPAL